MSDPTDLADAQYALIEPLRAEVFADVKEAQVLSEH